MNQETPPLFHGNSKSVRTCLEHASDMEVLLRHVVTAAGDNPSWKIHPYRAGTKNYVAFDIEGKGGTLNITIGIYGTILFPSAVDILRAREAVILVLDAFDAFHLVNAIHCRLGGHVGGSSSLQFWTSDVEVA